MSSPDARDVPLVVLADDGAPPSDVAWAWLISHPWTSWRLEVLTVRETLFPGGPPYGESQFVPRHAPAEAGFVTEDHLSVDGDPRVALLGRSEAAIIVVGSHHRGHLEGMLAGSTTEWLVVSPPVPLVVARHGHQTRSVAICVDGSLHARRALEAFLATPWASDVDLTLVSVDDGATDADEALAAARDCFDADTALTEVRLVGAPKRVIPALVRENGFDLVVMGTRGLTGFARVTTGSTVSALLKDDAANLLLAHEAHVAEDEGA